MGLDARIARVVFMEVVGLPFHGRNLLIKQSEDHQLRREEVEVVLSLLQGNGSDLVVVLPVGTQSLNGSQQVLGRTCSKLGLEHPRDVVEGTVLSHHLYLLHLVW